MGLTKFFALGFLGLSLVGCASSPYPEGRSPADVPANVNVILLKPVEMVTSAPEVNKFPNVDTAPSQNDREVLAVVKKSVVNQLTNYGFKVVEDDSKKADVIFKVFVDYTPEYGIVHRSTTITTYVLDPSDRILFWKQSFDYNANGLIGAVFVSRDDMVANAASRVTVDAVNEMRKGTK